MPTGAVRPPVLTLTTGPVEVYPEVSRALGRTMLYDHDPAFQAFYETLSGKLQRVFRSCRPPVILQGEPVLGLEAAAASLIGAADTVLNLVSGVYGKGFGGWARRHAGALVEVEVPYDQAIEPAAVEAALRRHPEVTIVSVCHHDTPSGTLNPVEAIGRICAGHGAYLIVDAVSSFAGMDVHPEDCAADIFITGPNKCLGCPPGLTLLDVSERAWAKMAANPAAPRASILGLLDWRHAWKCGEPFPFTPSIAELYGLDAALDRHLEEGPRAVWARHALTARACRAGILAMGVELWPASPAIAAPTATVVRAPPGIDEAALRGVARERFGVVFSAGRGATAGRVTRIGHMGPTAQPLLVLAALGAFAGAMRALGVRVDAGAAIEAALAVIAEAPLSADVEAAPAG